MSSERSVLIPCACSPPRDSMFRLLAITIRTMSLLLAGSALLALAVGLLLKADNQPTPVFSPRWETLNLDVRPERDSQAGYYLVDRESGRCELKSLPGGERWGLMSVSPWRDERGDSEIVGQCHTVEAGRDGTAFWGLARARQSDGTIIERIKLDVLPTSRACWLPDLPGEILFGAGDGQLYRYSLNPSRDGMTHEGRTPPVVPEGSGPRKITWKCQAPGKGTVFMADPFSPQHPLLHHLLFVVLSFKDQSDDRRLNGPPQPWWLQLSRDGTEIEDAGPLHDSGRDRTMSHLTVKRFPTVTVDRHGMIQLFYLARPSGHRAADLTAMQLEIDPRTGRPRPRAEGKPRLVARGCAAVPPICASDGTLVYGISQQSGVITGYRVEAEEGTPERIALARK